jgi:hypothetical protein
MLWIIDRLPKEISRMVELRRVRARRARGRIPAEVSDRAWNEAPALLGSISLRQGPFGLGLRWLVRYSPFQGCAGLAALPQAKIPPAIRKLILATGLDFLRRDFYFVLDPIQTAQRFGLAIMSLRPAVRRYSECPQSGLRLSIARSSQTQLEQREWFSRYRRAGGPLR